MTSPPATDRSALRRDANDGAERVVRATGSALGLASAAVARFRPEGRTLHPRGKVVPGVLRRSGARPRTGAAWLDDDGTDHVVVRRSRALGLPEPWPDLAGLAVRIPLDDGGCADLLLAAAGSGVVGRHLLRPATRTSPVLTTLLPLRTPTGHVVLGAFAYHGGRAFDLRASRPGGKWWDFGGLELDEPDGDPGVDPHQRFDGMLNPLPDMAFDRWICLVREPAYAAARRSGRRGRHVPDAYSVR